MKECRKNGELFSGRKGSSAGPSQCAFRIPLPHMGSETGSFLCAAFPISDCRITEGGFFMYNDIQHRPQDLLDRHAGRPVPGIESWWVFGRGASTSPLPRCPWWWAALLFGPCGGDADRRYRRVFQPDRSPTACTPTTGAVADPAGGAGADDRLCRSGPEKGAPAVWMSGR